MSHVDTASRIAGDRPVGVPVSGLNRNALIQFEQGSFFPLTRQGRYSRAFATAFTARPSVVITPLNSSVGTCQAILMGTPNVGSFRARLVMDGAAAGAGSINAYWFAIGNR